ncbi:MAG: hydantoinase/oxoprolinase family protein [Gammaproteobacteria bacterium]|nr:hydantoinase/oxoprolinase family protein [Gammaproteobacteria bacterium]
MTQSCTKLGIDIGGTFTDLALKIGNRVFSEKLPTTEQAPELAILDGISRITEKAAIHTTDIDMMIHGTTLATNALIQRKGAKTAFITTAGFRDVIEMRTENRFEQYDINLTLPPPLIERYHRYTVNERISATGKTLVSLKEKDIDQLIGRLGAQSYESIAIGLMHAYANSSHEQTLRNRIQTAFPGISISISSEVSPWMREYERFNTVCANAYVKPMIKSYLDRLAAELRDLGASCPIYLMHSGGGLISLSDATRFPVRLIESGPAGGVIFATDIARSHGITKALSFDMGGTTAKICLIKNAVPKTGTSFEVARSYRFKKGSGMPISIPVIEIIEIGAGGGSIAHVDNMQQIRVGPRSAGADIGPACYNRGGKLPTVTDANLLLGKLDPDHFAGGSIRLLAEKSESATTEHIGNVLSMPVLDCAFGICEVIDENMANAARMHAVENGEDLGEYTMIAFGGGAPLHAARLCEKLGIHQLLVPPKAGVGSAIGFLKAPFSFEAVRSDYQLMSTLDVGHIRDLVTALCRDVEPFVHRETHEEKTSYQCRAFMRYVGQGWEIPVQLDLDQLAVWDRKYLTEGFEQSYRALFARTVGGLDIEITNWSVKISSMTAQTTNMMPVPDDENIFPPARFRRVFDHHSKSFVETATYARNRFHPDAPVCGPAIVIENETTTVVPHDFSVTREPDGSLLVTG